MRSCPSDPEEGGGRGEAVPLTQPTVGRGGGGVRGQPHPTRDNGDDDDDDSATPLIGEEAAAGFIQVQFDADAGANVALLWSCGWGWGWGGGSTSGNDLVTSDADSCHKQQQLYAHN